jgi:hypothetical protein
VIGKCGGGFAGQALEIIVGLIKKEPFGSFFINQTLTCSDSSDRQYLQG